MSDDVRLCPKCGGEGRQIRPPWLGHEQTTWTSNNTGTYPCVMCSGKGLIAVDFRSGVEE